MACSMMRPHSPDYSWSRRRACSAPKCLKIRTVSHPGCFLHLHSIFNILQVAHILLADSPPPCSFPCHPHWYLIEHALALQEHIYELHSKRTVSTPLSRLYMHIHIHIPSPCRPIKPSPTLSPGPLYMQAFSTACSRAANTADTALMCPVCLRSFARNFHLQSHMEHVHGSTAAVSDARAKHICSVCQRQFALKCNLATHYRHHFPVTDLALTPATPNAKGLHTQPAPLRTEKSAVRGSQLPRPDSGAQTVSKKKRVAAPETRDPGASAAQHGGPFQVAPAIAPSWRWLYPAHRHPQSPGRLLDPAPARPDGRGAAKRTAVPPPFQAPHCCK